MGPASLDEKWEFGKELKVKRRCGVKETDQKEGEEGQGQIAGNLRNSRRLCWGGEGFGSHEAVCGNNEG